MTPRQITLPKLGEVGVHTGYWPQFRDRDKGMKGVETALPGIGPCLAIQMPFPLTLTPGARVLLPGTLCPKPGRKETNMRPAWQ